MVLNENLYIFGGVTRSGKPNSKTYYFNLTDQTWDKVSTGYSLNKVYFGSGVYSNKIYALAGVQPSTLVTNRNLDVFDVSTQKWTQSATLAPEIVEYASAQTSTSIYIFGGHNLTHITNQLLEFKLSTSKSSTLSKDFINPGAVRYGSVVSISNSLILFGGTKAGKKLNALWKFDLEKQTWTRLKTLGVTPPARSHAGIVCQGDILVIWGGQGEDSYLNDAYFYNFKTNTWAQIDAGTFQPNPQYGTCIALNFPYLYMFGGNTNAGTSGTLWLYDFSSNEYSLLEQKLEFTAGFNRFCDIQKTSNDMYLYIVLGTAEILKPLGFIERYSFASKSWKTVFTFDNFANNRSDAAIKIVNHKAYIFGGQTWGTKAKREIQIVDLKKGTFSVYKTQLPAPIFSAASAYSGNKLYVYGGGVEYGGQIVPFGASSSFYSLDLSEIEGQLQSLCSPGTYFSSKKCLFCPFGTYNPDYGQNSCQMCVVGTENPIVGAQSERQCYPCNQGFYSNESAQAECLKCPESYACPVGSSEFLLKYRDDGITSDQPGMLSRKTAEAKRLGVTIQIIVIIIGAFIVIILFTTEKTRKVLVSIDLYNRLHNYELDVPMMMRKTFFGSIFSMIFVILALILLIQTLILYFMDNVAEDKSLITMVILENQVDKFYADIDVEITFYNYGGNCVIDGSCSDNILVEEVQLNFDGVTRKCEKIKNSCSIFLTYENCEVNVESKILLFLRETFSYSSSIYVKFESGSSIGNKKSSITAEVTASAGKIFRGKDPTIFAYSLIPSLFDYDGSEKKGYHVTITSAPTPGTMIFPDDFGYTDYQSIVLSVSRDINALYIVRTTIYTLTLLVMALIGSIMGVMRMIGGAMSFVESNYLAQKAKQENKNKVQKLEDNRKLPLKNLVTEEDLVKDS